MPREDEIISSKIKQVAKEYNFTKAIAVKATYQTGDNSLLQTIQTIYNQYIHQILSNMSEFRYRNEEALYKELKQLVNHELWELKTAIKIEDRKMI